MRRSRRARLAVAAARSLLIVLGGVATVAVASSGSAPARATRSSSAKDLTVVIRLGQLVKQGQITSAQGSADLKEFSAALKEVKRLHGTRATELESVVENLHGIASSHQMTASRLPAMFLTLQENMTYWTSGPLLVPDARVSFPGASSSGSTTSTSTAARPRGPARWLRPPASRRSPGPTRRPTRRAT